MARWEEYELSYQYMKTTIFAHSLADDAPAEWLSLADHAFLIDGNAIPYNFQSIDEFSISKPLLKIIDFSAHNATLLFVFT